MNFINVTEIEHLAVAIENFRRAIEMQGNEGLFHLGLASVMDAAIVSKIKPGALPSLPGARAAVPAGGDFTPLWREEAIAEYRKAYELTIDKDQAIPRRPVTAFNSMVSYEAGGRYIAMTAARGVKEEEKKFVATVQAGMKDLESKPPGAITPIVFSIDRSARLYELLDLDWTVAFDLDGTGRPQRYTWVRPDTAILVWDPMHEGRISSGWQLFGSVSFDMFWADGYRALDALDGNRDGQLAGNELKGLAIWFDRNSNGVSDPGEVMAIKSAGIQAISTRATGRAEDSPANAHGLQMTEGARSAHV